MVTIGYAFCVLALLAVHAHGADTEIGQTDADDYLEKFGYLPARQRSGSPTQRAAARTRAISVFQDYAGLPVTGQLDEQTKEKMQAPRCGMSDKPRITRAAAKWKKPTLTWALEKGTNQLDQGRVKNAIKQAFAVWSEVIPFNFTEVRPQSGADFKFEFGSVDHGCYYKFDGEGMVLAHAFFPKDGRLHFDDDERWAFEDAAKVQQGYTDLLSVAIHELGHALGLEHSKSEDAIMYAIYRAPELVNGKLKQFQLSHIDIADIQKIYGPRAGATTRAPYVTPPGGPSTGAACPRFQAATTAGDGAIYLFQNGNQGWTKANANAPANSATRFYVDKRFPGFPSTGVTAAVFDTMYNITYLFSGRRAYAYLWETDTQEFYMEEGYPKDLPNTIQFTPEGALQWVANKALVLFGGDQFMTWYAANNDPQFLQKIENYFGKIPSKVSFSVGDLTHFVDATNVYVYDGKSQKVLSTQPLKTLITC